MSAFMIPKAMGNGNQILLMTIAFTWAVMVSLHFCFTTTNIIADAYEFQDWRHFMEDDGVRIPSGEDDEKEQKQPFLLKKFRTLLGLKAFNPRRSTKDDSLSGLSPSPSPAGDPRESPAPAPDPVRRVHPRHQHSTPRSSPVHTHHHTQKQKGHFKRILVPVLVSVAAGIAFVACVVGTACFYGKIKKQRKKFRKTWLSKRKKGKNSQSSMSKVSINPTLDFLYLNTQGVDLEMQTASSCHNQTQVTLLEREVKDQEPDVVPELDNVSSSSSKEIVSVYEDDDEPMRFDVCESERDGDIDTVHECRSSDDESFHSLVDSQSSRRSLSNASAVSINETLEIPPKNEKENSLDILPLEAKEQTATMASPPLPPPPPPPPLPPPPSFLKPRVFPSPSLSSSSSSSRLISNSSSSPFSSSFSPGLDSISSPKPNLQTHLPQEKSSHSFQDSPSYIPTPPPPPPPLAANNKTPPPPPSQFPLHPLLGKDGATLPKLKPLHWDKVRAAPDRSMVWDKLRTSSFELDEEMIESLFLQNSMCKNDAKNKPPSPGQRLLEPKRLQNITILLKALNANGEQICNALLKGEGLCLQQLEALVKMVPTKEEEAKINSYKGNVDELGSAEKFIKEMLSLPFAFLRAESMLFRETFEDEVIHLRNSFSMLEEACKELKSSRLFLKLLETVLKTGNRMNVGTIRGGARAFKLDALLKLSDVKGTDGKTTLLHFVVQEISRSEGVRVSDSIMGRIMNQKNRSRTVEEKEEDYRRMGLQLVSGLNTELYNVKKTATIDLDILVSSVSNLEEGINKLRHLLNVSLSECENHGSFTHSMNLFLSYAEKNIKKLQEDENRVMSRVREVAEYFHGDVSKDEKNPLRIFVIVRDFLGMLDHVCKDLRCLKIPNSPSPLAPFR